MNHRDYEPQLYFAYGSNLHEPQMLGRCPDARLAGAARLDGWRFAIGERGVATVVTDETRVVHGAVWVITDDDMAALDHCEGVHLDLYRRHTATVTRTSGPDAGATVSTEIYVETFTGPGVPRPGYLERILAGATALGLPETYLAELAQGGVR